MATTPQMRPVMQCCKNPDPAWIGRDLATKEFIRAYRCKGCGATDRTITQPESALNFRRRKRRPLRPRTAQIANLVELYRAETRGFSKRQLVARAKVYLSAKRGKLVA